MTIIVPSRNHMNLNACVDSIRLMGETSRIVVVRNGGLEPSRADVDYVDYGDGPFVYSRAINIGVKATPFGEDLVIVGDDTRLLTKHGYSKLFRNGSAITSASLTGACGNENQINQATYRLREEKVMLCFVAIAIPGFVWHTVGEMDERYCLDYGCEDGDYCYRARKAGFELLVDDGVLVEHGVLPSEYRKFGNLPFAQNAALFEKIHGVPYGS